MGNKFRVGEQYRDRGSPNKEGDQFSAWLRSPGKTSIKNIGGIRVLKIQTGKRNLENPYACVVIVSNKTAPSAGLENPWTDSVDFNNGISTYWGDAKRHPSNNVEDFPGNKILRQIFDAVMVSRRDLAPPILYFEKPESGWVRFMGLMVMESLSIDWFLDRGCPVPNYRFKLAILAVNEIDTEWIRDRVLGRGNDRAPDVWKHWVKTGRVEKLTAWRLKVLSKNEQLPQDAEGKQILRSLREEFEPHEFEHAMVNMLKRIPSISRVEVTRRSRDGGFDFQGTIWMDDIKYEMAYKGEVKQWKKTSAVGPKDLARLASRLQRGEFGMYFTTSFMSKQAQEEMYADNYPIRLYSGLDIVNLIRELQLVEGDELSQEWIDEVRQEARSPLS